MQFSKRVPFVTADTFTQLSLKVLLIIFIYFFILVNFLLSSQHVTHPVVFRGPGLSLSGGSQLHHQHQGQELSPVAAFPLQSALEPPLCQR